VQTEKHELSKWRERIISRPAQAPGPVKHKPPHSLTPRVIVNGLETT
jgi:hypothetical protein